MRVKIIINGRKSKTVNITESDIMIGLNSGEPFKNQWIFIDKDHATLDEVLSVGKEMLHEENLRRIVIVRTSKSKFHILSFSPKPYPEIINILHRYGTDGGHLAKTQDNGFSTVRITPKKGFKPELVTIMNNLGMKQQLNFYDFDAERCYLKLIGEKSD